MDRATHNRAGGALLGRQVENEVILWGPAMALQFVQLFGWGDFSKCVTSTLAFVFGAPDQSRSQRLTSQVLLLGFVLVG